MPFFDYNCNACNIIEEHLVKKFDTIVYCNVCGSEKTKLISAHAGHTFAQPRGTTKGRLMSFGTRKVKRTQ